MLRLEAGGAWKLTLWTAGLMLTAARALPAQDLEPRAYTAAPIGLHFLVASVGRSSGAVLVDTSLPIEDVRAVVESAAIGVGTTFDLAGRTALLVGVVPYPWAEASGRVGETAGKVTRSGFADPRVKLSVNLLGGEALRPREFAASRRPTILGVSLSIVAPVGQYYSDKLINLGTNRWQFKPEIGLSHAIGRWTIDGYTAVWLYTVNDAFFPGSSTRTQDPLFTVQAHASYTLRPRLWFAIDGTWYAGGTTTVNGVTNVDRQSNSRIGGTFSLPLTARQSLKASYSTGAKTRSGGDFNTVVVGWQLSWITPQRPPGS